MIIGLSGRCCSGKTTFLEHFRLEHPEYGYVSECVRELLRNMRTDLRTIREDPKTYWKFQKLVLDRYVKDVDRAYQYSDVVITDRTLYDILIYSKLYLPQSIQDKFGICIRVLSDYLPDRLIYFEPLDYWDDGVRSDDKLEEELKLFEEIVKPKANLVVDLRRDTYADIRNNVLKIL